MTTFGLITLAMVLGAYVLGSVSSGRLVARGRPTLPDPRTIGSGSYGATNMLRTGSKVASVLTLLGDAGKGALAVGLMLGTQAMMPWFGVEVGRLGAVSIAGVGLAAMVGHCFPFYDLKHGGKGVATFMGALVVMHPLIGLLSIVAWIVVAAVGRYSSLASLTAIALSPVMLVGIALAQPTAPSVSGLTFTIGGLVLVWVRHRGNLARLRDGTEARITFKRPSP